MPGVSGKYKLLFLPYLLVLFGYGVAYSCSIFLFSRLFSHTPLSTDAVEWILPSLFAWLPVLLVFGRRAKLVVFGGRYKEGFIFQILIWAAIVIPAIFLQFYLNAFFGKISRFDYLVQLFGLGVDVSLSNLLVITVASYSISLLAVVALLYVVTLDPWETARYNAGVASAHEHELSFLVSFFLPRGKYFYTPLLLDINILVFLVMCLSGFGFKHFNTAGLVLWGANFGPLTAHGQWWRLLSSIFLHGGVMHLLSNMVSLVFIGSLLEPVVGRPRFLTTYILSGIVASINSLMQHDAAVSVGASGAIFGLYGMFVALLVARVFPKDFRRQFLRMILIFLAYNLAMGVTGNIDNAAHIGGLILGFCMGIVFSGSIKRRNNFR